MSLKRLSAKSHGTGENGRNSDVTVRTSKQKEMNGTLRKNEKTRIFELLFFPRLCLFKPIIAPGSTEPLKLISIQEQ